MRGAKQVENQENTVRQAEHVAGGRIGIDLGGTKTEVAVLGPDNAFRFRHRVPTPQGDYDAILATIAQLVRLARETCGVPTAAPVGIGMPGCVDPASQRVRGANTQVLNGQFFIRDVQQVLGCAVAVENDANCLALSEAVDGAAAQARVTFAVIIGTGCGGGMAWGHTVWPGRNALAGEWGHNPLPWPTAEELAIAPCWCGQRGCLESWISGPGFAADHQRATRQTLRAEQIIARMRAGEVDALQSFQRYVDRLARSLAQVINLLDPDVIVLGGGMSQVTELYDVLPEQMARHTFTRPVTTPVRPALHGDASGVRGAAWLTQRG